MRKIIRADICEINVFDLILMTTTFNIQHSIFFYIFFVSKYQWIIGKQTMLGRGYSHSFSDESKGDETSIVRTS